MCTPRAFSFLRVIYMFVKYCYFYFSVSSIVLTSNASTILSYVIFRCPELQLCLYLRRGTWSMQTENFEMLTCNVKKKFVESLIRFDDEVTIHSSIVYMPINICWLWHRIYTAMQPLGNFNRYILLSLAEFSINVYLTYTWRMYFACQVRTLHLHATVLEN